MRQKNKTRQVTGEFYLLIFIQKFNPKTKKKHLRSPSHTTHIADVTSTEHTTIQCIQLFIYLGSEVVKINENDKNHTEVTFVKYKSELIESHSSKN